jgi:hypothetical protein
MTSVAPDRRSASLSRTVLLPNCIGRDSALKRDCHLMNAYSFRPTAQTTLTTAAMPSTDVGQAGSTGPRNIDGSAGQPLPVSTATQEPASGTVPAMQVAAAVPDAPSSDADRRPTAATAPIWPDPPPIPPSVQAEDAGAATASHDSMYSVAADTSDNVSRKDERTSWFDIPIGLSPAFAFGLVVLGFGLRLLMKRAAARRAQEIVHTEAVTTPTHDYARPSGNGLADESTNFSEDEFQTFCFSGGRSRTVGANSSFCSPPKRHRRAGG